MHYIVDAGVIVWTTPFEFPSYLFMILFGFYLVNNICFHFEVTLPAVFCVYATGNMYYLAVQIDPMILLLDLVRLNLNQSNGMFTRSTCTSLDQSELKINIQCNIYTLTSYILSMERRNHKALIEISH